MADRIPSAAIVFYEDHLNTKPLRIESIPWSPEGVDDGSGLCSVVTLFSEHEFTDCAPCPGGNECKKKFADAFSPAVPRSGTTRADESIDWVSLLVFDFDHITLAELEGVSDRLAGLESLLCSTHSHRRLGNIDDNCVRIVFPLARPLAPEEYRAVHREVRRRYGLEWLRPGAKKRVGADSAAKDISRIYFLPTAPIGSTPLFGHEEGALLDLDELLRSAPPKPPAPPRAPIASEPESSEEPTDMASLRRLMRGYNPKNKKDDEDEIISRKELVRRVEAGEPLVKEDEVGQRERSCHRIGTILAWLFPKTTPDEVMEELVRASIVSMPTYANDGEKDTIEERFLKVRYSWIRGAQGRVEHEAAKAQKKADEVELRTKFKARFKISTPEPSHFPPPPPPPQPLLPRAPLPPPPPRLSSPRAPAPPALPAPSDDEPSPDGWEDLLMWIEAKDGSDSKVLKNFDSNAEAILAYSPQWHGVLRYNEVTKDVLVEGGPLETFENTPAQVTSGTKYWLQRTYGLNLRKNEVMDAIVHVAKRNAFDPVKDYLNGVKGDDTARIDTFLENYCGALTVDGNGNDITEHIRRISRYWFVGSVARGLDPGCKMDTVLILEGEQGVKKSTMLDVLGGEFFTDSPIVIGKNDAMMLAGRSWIAEMAELSSFHASDVQAQKSFFSSRVDKFRPPYGYAIEEFPRRCAFAGSTNDEKYMNDITGNRRFWAARCMKFDVRKARRDRDKIWAEAVRIYKAGFSCAECAAAKDGEDRCPEHRWWLNKAEDAILESINNQRLRDEFSEAIIDYILKLDPPTTPPKINQRPTAMTIYEIATEALKLSADRVSSQQGPIGRALKTLGFTKDRVMENGVRVVWHVLPKELLNAPKRERAPGRHLRAVPSPKASAPRGETK